MLCTLPLSLFAQGLANDNGKPLVASSGKRLYAQPFYRQLVECTRKLSQAYWRMPSYNLTRLIMTVVCAFIYGLMYFGVRKACVMRSRRQWMRGGPDACVPATDLPGWPGIHP